MKAVAGLFGGAQKAPDTSAQEAILARQEARAEEEKKRLAEEQMARVRASRRGGFRGLLASERLNAESGLANTLGPGA